MVRVISVHHFSGQAVTKCARPLTACLAGANTLVTAHEDQTLEIKDLKKGASHRFQSLDQVQQLCYSPIGRYLATLEGTRSNSVRVYCNWDDPSLEDAPLRPRIAGCVTPSQRETQGALDVIEFPQRDEPLRVAVCASTGNLMVAAANLLVVYKISTKTQDTTKSKYIDFEECLHVFHNFVPTEVSLSEDVIGCLSQSELHVFKVRLLQQQGQDERSLRSLSLYSVSSELGETTRRSTDDSNSTDEEKIRNVTLQRQMDSEANEPHLEGYIGNVRRHPNHVYAENAVRVELPEVLEANRQLISVVNSPKIMEQTLGPTSPPESRTTTIKYVGPSGQREDSFEAECVSLIHCQLLKNERTIESFKNLNVKPVYWREYRVKSHRSVGGVQQPLHSSLHVHLMSFTVCFTSQSEGYLYHVPGHIRKSGKGCGVQRIATYPFTSPVGEIALEPTLLHALTETGLETYTLKSGYHTVQEAENLNSRTNACPSSEENPICLVGLRPFLGATKLMVSSSFLVLLAQGDGLTPENPSAQNDWTIYSLTLPSSIDVHRDMLQLADLNKALSPHGYYQLLCEAHMVLRTSFRQLSWQQAIKANGAEEDAKKTKEKYQETCKLLATHYLLQESSKEWKLSLPYLRMSGCSVASAITLMKGHWRASSKTCSQNEIPPGLLHYIREVVLKPVANENVMDASLKDELIELLGEHSLDTLATLVIKSPNFREFKTDKMFGLLHKSLSDNASPSAEMAFALALLSLERGEKDGEAIRRILNRMSGNPVELSSLLIDNHEFLFENVADETSFSELAMLLQESLPQMFVEVLVSLIIGNVFRLCDILQLFLGTFVSMSNIEREAAQRSAMLQLFLETYFLEFDLADSVTEEAQMKALQTLVRSYLTSLTVPVRFGDKNIDADMFGNRFLYLDKLPPFQNSAKEILDADSPDFWCQNSLLKLQSLLSSKSLGLPECKDTVRQFFDQRHSDSITGELSLRVLSSSPEESLSLLCRDHPSVLLHYAKESSFSEDQWRACLMCLQDSLTGSEEDDPMHEAWYSVMQEILDHLAQSLSLETFLQVLPSPHSNDDFQGYIQMCRKNQQASDIQGLIVSTGNKLLSTLAL